MLNHVDEEPAAQTNIDQVRAQRLPTNSLWSHPVRIGVLLITLLAIAFLLYWAIWAGISPEWTGFGAYDQAESGPRAKTLWDWLDLLIVPIVLGLGAYWLNSAQKKTELKIAEDQRNEDRLNAKKQRDVDLRIARERQWQETLEAYFDRMTDLLLNYGLRTMVAVGDEERTLARARTLAVLRSVDSTRKGQVVQFLHEAGLIRSDEDESQESRVLLLLHGADLSGASLQGADLHGANLSRANLYGAQLRGANLQQANLSETNLEHACLDEANLSQANLLACDLRNTSLLGTQLRLTQLANADLAGATLGDAYLGGANLHGVNLSHAILTNAFLQVNLTKANLSNADLSHANLSGADLTLADLRGAILTDTILKETNFTNAKYDTATAWPQWFDPDDAGAMSDAE